MSFAIVVPTVGRPSLTDLLRSLTACDGPRPSSVVLVDDRPGTPDTPVLASLRRDTPAESPQGGQDLDWVAPLLEVRCSGGRGPAAARNVGWRATDAEWVVFLDDDVRVTPDWLTRLATDLAGAEPAAVATGAEPAAAVGAAAGGGVAASQGRITVPLPADRPATDWERCTAGLETAKWITADIAYRRPVLEQLGGFDERFQRAFREDADLALRAVDAGYRIVQGGRRTVHPVRPAPWWISVATQRGNADDALMRALHGRDWHERADAPVGRRPWHLVTTSAAAAAVGAAIGRRPLLAGVAALAWAAGTADFAARRIAPGPRDAREVAAMIATSAAIPPVATWHWLRGLWQHRGARPWQPPATPIAAVLVDRDGTIVRDVPYNGVPELVEPLPGARAALDRLRAAGVKVAVITNQSGVARGSLTMPQVRAVNARVDELLGPFADWQVCPHGEDDGCDCRKPRPGMVLAAAEALGVDVADCVVVGDTGADVAAALAAGARGVLVPNDVTRREEIAQAPLVFARLDEAVDALLTSPEVAR